MIDGVANTDISIVAAFSAEIAQRRESGQQGFFSVNYRARRTQRKRFFQDLIIPRSFVVGMQEQMTVRIDEAGQEGGVAEID